MKLVLELELLILPSWKQFTCKNTQMLIDALIFIGRKASIFETEQFDFLKDIVAGVEEKQSTASSKGAADGEEGEAPASGKAKRQKTTAATATASDSNNNNNTNNEKEYKFVVYGAPEAGSQEKPVTSEVPAESKAAISSVLNNDDDDFTDL